MKLKKLRNNRNKILKTLSILFKINKIYFVVISISTIISGIIPFFTIKSMQNLINGLQNVTNGDIKLVIEVLIIYVTVNIISILNSSLKGYITGLYKMKVDYVINEKILQKSKSLSLSDYENENVYNMLRKAQDNSSSKIFSIYLTINYVVTQLIVIVSVSTIILSWNPLIFLVISIIPIIQTIHTANLGHRAYIIEMNRTDKRRKISYINYLMTNDIAYKELKSYNGWDFFLNIFKKNFESIIGQDKKILKEQTSISIVLTISDEIIGAIIIYIMVTSSILGNIMIGDTVALINTMATIQGNISGLLKSIIELYKENLYIEELYKLLDYKTKESKGTIIINEITEVEFANVNYRYQSRNEYSIKNLNFKIARGDTVSLIGENGSGKTTLIKLLAGFYDDYEGEIKVNGIDLRKIDKENYQKKIAILFQDFNKYELNLRENIGIGKIEFKREYFD